MFDLLCFIFYVLSFMFYLLSLSRKNSYLLSPNVAGKLETYDALDLSGNLLDHNFATDHLPLQATNLNLSNNLIDLFPKTLLDFSALVYCELCMAKTI